jgi:hypothetical protein
METDPLQEYLLFLYNYRWILFAIVFVAAFNGVATFFKSIITISDFIKKMMSFIDDNVFPKKKLYKETMALLEEMNLSLNLIRNKHLTEIRLAVVLRNNENSVFSQELRAVYIQKYLHKIEDLKLRYGKYKISNDYLEAYYKNPRSERDIISVKNSLNECASKLKEKKSKNKPEENKKQQ